MDQDSEAFPNIGLVFNNGYGKQLGFCPLRFWRTTFGGRHICSLGQNLGV